MSEYTTINEIRRENLRYLIDRDYEGIDRKLALKLKVQPTQISRYFSKSKSRRNISDEYARKIEKASGLDEGWMDEPRHIDPEEHIGISYSDGDQVREYLEQFRADVAELSEKDRQKVLQEIREALSPAGKLAYAQLLLSDLAGEL